jgi:hypothetical protein
MQPSAIPPPSGIMEDFGSHFNVSQSQQGHQTVLVGQNWWPIPVTVELSVDGENVTVRSGTTPDARVVKLKTLHVLPANSAPIVLAACGPLNPSLGWHMTYMHRGEFGAGNIVHDSNVLYKFPFEEHIPRECGQSFGGTFSHTEASSFHAVDFLMPIGTPVLAARAGVVLATKADGTLGGCDESLRNHANVVFICHSDGSVAVYAHLAPQGVTVAFGTPIQEGQLIGYSGNTGYTQAPHLHFHVCAPDGTPKSSQAWRTVPFAFSDPGTNAACVPTAQYQYPGGPSMDVGSFTGGQGPHQQGVSAKAAPAKAGMKVGPKGGPLKKQFKKVAGGGAGQPQRAFSESVIPSKPMGGSMGALPPVNRAQQQSFPPVPPHQQQQPQPPQQQQQYVPPLPQHQVQYQQPQQQQFPPVPPHSNQPAHPMPPPPGSNAPPPSQVPATKEWKGKYASPALLPVKPKPPAVDRAVKPARAMSQGFIAPPLEQYPYPQYAQPYDPNAPQQPAPYYDPNAPPPYYDPNAPPPQYNSNDPNQPHNPNVVSSMTPGVRVGPPSRALHPEYYKAREPEVVAAPVTPSGQPVVNSMQPGYVRETDIKDDVKRALDIKRHNPVKKANKKLSMAMPDTKSLARGLGL